MKRKIRLIAMYTLSLLLGGFAQASVRPLSDGMPGPWPFPWAKECPIVWESTQGRYYLSDSANHEQLDMQITMVPRANVRMIRLSRYGHDGALIGDGYSWVANDTRVVRLWLFPLRKGDPATWAVLKFYYKSSLTSCNNDSLVPILTLDRMGGGHKQSQYRLVRMVGPK